MRLKGHRFGTDLLIYELGQLIHDVSLDLIKKSLEIASIDIGEPLGVTVDLLAEGLGLLKEVALKLLKSTV